MTPGTLQQKRHSAPPSAGCPTTERVEPGRMPSSNKKTPSSSPRPARRDKKRYSYSTPLCRIMSPYKDLSLSPEKNRSDCSSSSSPSRSSSFSSPSSIMSNGSRRSFSFPPRRRLAWVCNLWIAMLTVTYINLSLQYNRNQRMNEIRTTTLKPLLLQIEFPHTAGIDNDTETKQWNELYAREERKYIDKKVTHQPRVFQSFPKYSNKQEKTDALQNVSRTTFQNEIGKRQEHLPSSKNLRYKTTYKPDCVEKAEWHSFNFVNCNTFHEIDFAAGLAKHQDAGALEYHFRGGTRETWLYENASEEDNLTRTILKTLRWIKDYDEIRFDRQRVDALALERLTGSPHVVDVFGYCGMSALNEFGEIGHFGRYYATNHPNVTPSELLAYARDAALGLADVHEIQGTKGSNVTTLVHHDLSPKNLVMTADNKIKLSDFNDGQLLRWNFQKHKRCKGFDWDNLCGTTIERTNRRAPEECTGGSERYGTTERTEVYHLGAIFHFMLSKEQFPYRFEEQKLNGTFYQPSAKEVKELILNGTQPPLPTVVEESRDPAIRRLICAMKNALIFDEKKRPSAREIAAILDEGAMYNPCQKQDLQDEQSRVKRKTSARSGVDTLKAEQRDFYDLPQEDEKAVRSQSKGPKGQVEANEGKPASVFTVQEELTFDPYSAAGHF